jgi:hypothetical protein
MLSKCKSLFLRFCKAQSSLCLCSRVTVVSLCLSLSVQVDFQHCSQYMGFVSFMILIWDHITTFDDEVCACLWFDFKVALNIFYRWSIYGKGGKA